MIAISLANVSLILGARPIFRNLTWEIQHDQRIGLIGPNGAGKSSLFKLITGEFTPEPGGAAVKAKGVTVGYLPQDPDFDPGLTALAVTLTGNARLAEVEAELIAFLAQYLPEKTSPMCGNSVCQDRRFLARYMPRLEAFFHYRNLDVSTLKELAKRWKPELMAGLTKHGKHEALADIYESIEELKYYRENLLKL